jgi:hypothetical protein
MVVTEDMFKYSDSWELMRGDDDFVLKVPVGIRSKAELLEAFASAGHFPDYFGWNWDALQDCLRDLSWICSRRVVVMHRDLPLLDDPAECRIYLEILLMVLTDWTGSIRPDAAESPPEWPYVEHELIVIFPANARGAVVRTLAGA